LGIDIKLIINMDKIIFKFLDMELDGIEEVEGNYVDIVLKHSGEEHGIIGIEKMGKIVIKVYVFYPLVKKIMSLFSMELSDALEVIGRYVGNRYNLRVIHTQLINKPVLKLLGIDTI
jgi:hypothetical protein